MIENRILERDMAAKRRAEKLAKNIAVTFLTFPVSISNLFLQSNLSESEQNIFPNIVVNLAKKTTCPSP